MNRKVKSNSKAARSSHLRLILLRNVSLILILLQIFLKATVFSHHIVPTTKNVICLIFVLLYKHVTHKIHFMSYFILWFPMTHCSQPLSLLINYLSKHFLQTIGCFFFFQNDGVKWTSLRSRKSVCTWSCGCF